MMHMYGYFLTTEYHWRTCAAVLQLPYQLAGRAQGVPAAGSSWGDGTRAFLGAAMDAMGPGGAIFSESNAEAYLADVHSNMAL